MTEMGLISAEPVEGERIRFGPFCLHISAGRLLHNATPVPRYDCALSQAVNRLRRGLEAFEATTDYVRTVRGFGYRLVSAGRSPSNGVADEPLFLDPEFRRCQLAVFKQNNEFQMVE
jgi:hypothetical protein